MNNVNNTLVLNKEELNTLLTEAAKQGAYLAIAGIASYNLGDACKLLKISYATLQKRILSGKIKAVDGRISGAEIQRYLCINPIKRR